MLRLAASTVGPVSIAAGANGASQTVEAYNAGDGSLALSLSSSVPWINPTVGTPRACTTTTSASSCLPLQFTLNTSSLAAGIFTGIVTVSDPNAADAPQTITVTVQMGGGVPTSVDLYVAPGGSRDVPFSTNSQIFARPTTQDGNSWLTVVLDGSGSFRFVLPYRIHIQPPASMAPGTYTGSLVTTGSTLAAENKTVPVTMRITTQPIATVPLNPVNVRALQGVQQNVFVGVTNLGQGTLQVQSANAQGGTWINAVSSSTGAMLTLDSGEMPPGSYTGSLTFTTNAANVLPPIPVNFEVVAKGPPTIPYQGVVDNAIFAAGDSVAPGDILAVFGEQFSYDDLKVGPAPPLTTTIGTTQVLVNGQAVPLYFTSYGQIDFQLPYNAPPGNSLVQVVRDNQTSPPVSINVAPFVPRIPLIGGTQFGAIQNAADYSIPMPAGSLPGYGPGTHPASIGDTLIIYAIGLGATNPAVAAGAPAPSAEPFARAVNPPVVNFGGPFGTNASPIFVGLSPGFAGLYQVNVTIPPETPKGVVDVTLVIGSVVSNLAQIAVH